MAMDTCVIGSILSAWPGIADCEARPSPSVVSPEIISASRSANSSSALTMMVLPDVISAGVTRRPTWDTQNPVQIFARVLRVERTVSRA
jgi:hypothetical protein